MAHFIRCTNGFPVDGEPVFFCILDITGHTRQVAHQADIEHDRLEPTMQQALPDRKKDIKAKQQPFILAQS